MKILLGVLGSASDSRAEQLAANLVRRQWPNGGRNCDRRAEASHSLLCESLIPLHGLALHARLTGTRDSRGAAVRAAEFGLTTDREATFPLLDTFVARGG